MISADRRFWSLVFLLDDGGYQMILKLNQQAPFFQEMICCDRRIVLRDGTGQVLIEGVLDEDGELEVSWTLPVNPYNHFLITGSCQIDYELEP